MPNFPALAANCVSESLRGARVIASIEVYNESRPEESYQELGYIVAWERSDQCGTHRVQVNSKGEAMCVHGHYDLPDRNAAIEDMINRLPHELKEIINNA